MSETYEDFKAKSIQSISTIEEMLRKSPIARVWAVYGLGESSFTEMMLFKTSTWKVDARDTSNRLTYHKFSHYTGEWSETHLCDSDFNMNPAHKSYNRNLIFADQNEADIYLYWAKASPSGVASSLYKNNSILHKSIKE